MVTEIESPSWWGYYNQYKIITDKLIQEDKSLLDNLITLPFLYCLSHTIELGFKASIIDFTGNLPQSNKNHELKDLFKVFKDELLNAMEKNQLIEPAKKNIISVLNELEVLVDLYSKLHPIHQSLRYPISSNNKRLFNFNDGIKDVKIDQVINLYNKTNKLITWVTSVFCDQYIVDDIIDDLPEEYI